MEKKDFLNRPRLGEPQPIGQVMAGLADNPESLLYSLSQHQRVERSAECFPLSELMDGYDVMNALHISQRTLQTLRTNGTLPYSKLGNKIYYRRRDLEHVLADRFTMWRLNNPEGYGETRR